MSNPDSLSTLVATAVAADEQVRARVISFATTVLDEAEYLIKHGAPTVKLRLMQTVISTALRDTSRTNDESSRLAEGRAEIEQMFSDVRERLLSGMAREAPAMEGMTAGIDMPEDDEGDDDG